MHLLTTGCGGVVPAGGHVDGAGGPGAGGRLLQEGHRRRATQHALPPVAMLPPRAGEKRKINWGPIVRDVRQLLEYVLQTQYPSCPQNSL